jgi:hypothetical protein
VKLNIKKALATGTATAALVTATLLGTASPAAAFEYGHDFNCPSADTPTNCDIVGIVDPWLIQDPIVDIGVYVSNHANYGERCQLLNGAGAPLGPWVYINAGDNDYQMLGRNLPANTRVDLRCQRRSDHGDAGIGGVFQVSIPGPDLT